MSALPSQQRTLTKGDGYVSLVPKGGQLNRKAIEAKIVAIVAPGVRSVIAGTLAYMAPEQTGRMNRSVDSRSDTCARKNRQSA